ncbi:MAG: DUF3189 family protein [Bacillota bacterium]
MKKIIYHCYGGSHSSVVTSAIHLGYLSKDAIPTPEELMKLPFFDKQNDADHGTLNLMGIDQFGNEVYICGCRNHGKILANVMNRIAEIAGIDMHSIKCIDTLKGVNLLMRLGGFISRKLRLIAIGRPLVIKGTLQAYDKFIQIVAEDSFAKQDINQEK